MTDTRSQHGPTTVTESDSRLPAVSVVVVTDNAETIVDVVDHLRAQTIHEQIELVVPTPNPTAVELAGLDDGQLAAVTIVEIQAITPLAAARATGVRAAAAPYVFLGETHSYPQPQMLELLLDAHRAGWERAAPVFTNANPTNALSWAAFLIDYGRFAGPAGSGEAPVPVYNCSYRQSMLLELDATLDRLIESGSTLNHDLRAAGCRFFRVGEASIGHLNVATPLAFLRQRYLIGRNIGARLARRWPVWRRVVYVAGAPLIPALLAARALRSAEMRDRVRAAPTFTLTAMLLGFVLRGAGEAVGYAVGAGSSEGKLDEMEIHKRRYT